MKKKTVLLSVLAAALALLCFVLLLNLAACEKLEETVSSELVSSQVVSSEPEEEESSVPEPESSTFVPAPDLIPSSDVEDMGDFDYAFSQNPIDKDYDNAYNLASSFSMMRQACDEAASRWKAMVDVAYDAAAEALSPEERLDLQAGQDQWKQDLDEQIEAIRAEAGDSNDGILASAKEIVLLYRERAKELCRVKYDQDGELPEFPEAAPAFG